MEKTLSLNETIRRARTGGSSIEENYGRPLVKKAISKAGMNAKLFKAIEGAGFDADETEHFFDFVAALVDAWASELADFDDGDGNSKAMLKASRYATEMSQAWKRRVGN